MISHPLRGEIEMSKKSLTSYVSEIRKELLTKSGRKSGSLSYHDGAQAKPVKAARSRVIGGASGSKTRAKI